MKIKALIGVLLIALSIGGLYLWETRYRDEFTAVSVVAAAKDIKAGETVDSSFFKVMKIYPENTIQRGLSEENIADLDGMVCTSDIYENEQISVDRFAFPETLDHGDERILVIPKSWLYMLSSQFVTGDMAEIYFMPERSYAGTFKVSLVTEESLEIVCRMEDYFALYDRVCATDSDGNSQKLMCIKWE